MQEIRYKISENFQIRQILRIQIMNKIFKKN